MAIQEIHDFHVDLAGQHHLHDFHRGIICDPHPMAKLGFNAQALEHLIDLGSPAVHDDRIETHIFQEHDILREALFQQRIGHRMTAVFNHNGLALERANVGQGFDQNVRFLNQSVHAWLPLRETREDARTSNFVSRTARDARAHTAHRY